MFFFFILFVIPIFITAQPISDSLIQRKDPINQPVDSYTVHMQDILRNNHLLNSSGQPIALATEIRKMDSTDWLFYFLLLQIGMLAFFRVFLPAAQVLPASAAIDLVAIDLLT